ncbi:MAG: hypothetical protein Q9209_006959 [Squamulea sp. 1 TL-2023]
MYLLVALFSIFLFKPGFGLPFTATTTVSPDVSQIGDGQVQAGTQAPFAKLPSSISLSGPSMTMNQTPYMNGSSIFTITKPDSVGSLTTQTTTATGFAIKTFSGGGSFVGLPTTQTDDLGQTIMRTSTINSGITLLSQNTVVQDTATVAVGPQKTTKKIQATGSTDPVDESTAVGFSPTSTLGPTSGQTELDSASLVSASSAAGFKPFEPVLGQAGTSTAVQTQQEQSDPTAILGSSPSISSLRSNPLSTSSLQSKIPSQDSVAFTSGPSNSLPIEHNTVASIATSGAFTGPVAPSHVTGLSITGFQTQSVEDPVGENTVNVGSPILPEAKTPGLAQMASSSTPNPGTPGLSSLSDATITPPLNLEPLITTQITDPEGLPTPAVVILTTSPDGATSMNLVPLLPITATDLNPTSTMNTIPPGLSVEEATNPAWITNTWVTTTKSGGSDPTIVPVLVGCPGCGPRDHGLILWNLPKLPRVQFHFPGLPKVPRFHIPCLRILGIRVGSCSEPSKLPDIITDPPDPSDPKPKPGSNMEPSNLDDEKSNPDEQSSMASDPTSTSQPSSTRTSSVSSSSSSSTSSCPNGLTIDDITICSVPTLKAVVDLEVQMPISSVLPVTGANNPPSPIHHVMSVASSTFFAVSTGVSTSNSFDISEDKDMDESMTSSTSIMMTPQESSSPSLPGPLPMSVSVSMTSSETLSPSLPGPLPMSVSIAMTSQKDSIPSRSGLPSDATISLQATSSSDATSSSMTTPTLRETSSSASAPLENAPSEPTIAPVDPPSEPNCYLAPTGKYKDAQKSVVDFSAPDFCYTYREQILHEGDAKVEFKVDALGSGNFNGYVSVEWIAGCSHAEGYHIGDPSPLNPDWASAKACTDLLSANWYKCNNKGRGGCVNAGCLSYCLVVKLPTIEYNKHGH